MQKYIGTAIKKDVNNPTPAGETPAVGVDVYVKLRSTGAIANIYKSNGFNPITQPLVTDANGRFEFYAANDRYNIEYSLPSGTIIDADVILEDPTDRKATTDEAKTGANDNKFVTPLGVHQSFNQFGIGKSSPNGSPSGGSKNIYNTGTFSFITGSTDWPVGFSVGSSLLNIVYTTGASGSQSQLIIDRSGDRAVIRGRNIGIWGDDNEIYLSSNLVNAQNLSGSTVAINQTVAGSSLSPAKTGTWRNVCGNDVLNNDYGLFKKD